MENLNPNENNTSKAGMSSCSGGKVVAPSLKDKKPLILQAITEIRDGITLLELLLRKGVNDDEIDDESIEIIHQISRATNQVKYNTAVLRDVYDAIGRPKEVLRFFNFVDGDCIEVSREEYKGEYTPEQEIPY